MDERRERFLGLPELLSGFGRVQLLGTGMADGYLQALDAVLPPAMLDELLVAYEQLPLGPAAKLRSSPRFSAMRSWGPPHPDPRG